MEGTIQLITHGTTTLKNGLGVSTKVNRAHALQTGNSTLDSWTVTQQKSEPVYAKGMHKNVHSSDFPNNPKLETICILSNRRDDKWNTVQ